MNNFFNLQENIQITFNDVTLLRDSLVHRSYLNENYDLHRHNERLEFLGDAVLELVVTEYLYRNYDKDEGELTNWRSALVRTEHLAEVARTLQLGEFVYLSKGEDKSGGREKDHILANTLEALIGAIYLDQGYSVAEQFILKHLLVNLEKILDEKKHIDNKSFLQEMSQEKLSITPIYKSLGDSGPDHDKTFTMGVYFNNELIAEGTGSSKQAAEQDAAQNAIKAQKWDIHI